MCDNCKQTDKVKDIYPAIIIFSVTDQAASYFDNNVNRCDVVRLLDDKGVSFKQVDGAYEGQAEDSFIVSENQRPLVLELCRKYKQDCFLVVDQYRNARLDCWNGNILVYELGKLQRVSKAEAIKSGNWTLDGSQYWMVH